MVVVGWLLTISQNHLKMCYTISLNFPNIVYNIPISVNLVLKNTCQYLNFKDRNPILLGLTENCDLTWTWMKYGKFVIYWRFSVSQ